MDTGKPWVLPAVLAAALAILTVAVHHGLAGSAPPAAAPVAAAASPAPEAPKPQTKCPILGGTINKDHYVDVEGCRIYVCCPPCIEKVKADPKAAIAKIRANGEEPEKAPMKAPEKKL